VSSKAHERNSDRDVRHKHTSVARHYERWIKCVTPNRCAHDPGRQCAHGAVVRVDICLCGAIRKTEINGRKRNRGTWEVQ